MQTIRAREKTGKDGALSLHIPLGQPNAEFDVTVLLQPTSATGNGTSSGWPANFFEETFGSIADDSFDRPPQGKLPTPPELD